LILRKISKFVATRCQILRLKCTKFDCCWGCAPDPSGGAYSAPPYPQLYLRGTTSKESEGLEGGERKGRREEKENRKGEGKEFTGPVSNCFLLSWGSF